jgi:hypothetical protein
VEVRVERLGEGGRAPPRRLNGQGGMTKEASAAMTTRQPSARTEQKIRGQSGEIGRNRPPAGNNGFTKMNSEGTTMAKTPSHIEPLPAGAMPAQSSTQLIREHIARLKDERIPQKVIALSLGFGANYVSMLKKGEELPLPRVLAFAVAARLSDQDKHELLRTRLMELHGQKGEICMETIATWAAEMCAPFGDEAKLLDMWREAASSAPWLVAGLLDEPSAAARVKAAIEAVVQEELRKQADEAADL